MDFGYLYLRTSGRISRLTWWIGLLILAAVNVVIAYFILPIVGLGAAPPAMVLHAQPDATQYFALVKSLIQRWGWSSLVLLVVSAYPGYCLLVKRRHDRNSSGRDVLVYFAAMFTVSAWQATGAPMADVDGETMPVPDPFMISLIFLAFGIYMLVVLGLLKGTDGANRYGPDPLQPQPTAGTN